MASIPPKPTEHINMSPTVSERLSHLPQKTLGSELGNDQVSLSKEFAKGTSTGAVAALSSAKETAKVDKQRQSEEVSLLFVADNLIQ
jgi:hypothetical protein